MSSNPKASVTSIRVFQEKRIGQRVDEIVDRLKDQHVEIEDMVSRLLRCLAAIRTVERSVDAMASVGAIDEMQNALTDAQAVLSHVSALLDRMGARSRRRPARRAPVGGDPSRESHER